MSVEFFAVPKGAYAAPKQASVLRPLNENGGDSPISSLLRDFFPPKRAPCDYVFCRMPRKDFEEEFSTRVGYQLPLFTLGGKWELLRNPTLPESLDAILLPHTGLLGYQEEVVMCLPETIYSHLRFTSEMPSIKDDSQLELL